MGHPKGHPEWSRSTGAAIHFSAKEEVADRYTGGRAMRGEVRNFILMGRYARLQTTITGDGPWHGVKNTLTDPDTGLVVWEDTNIGDEALSVENITPRTLDNPLSP